MSPRGIFLRLTQTERDALRAVQLGRLTSGDRTGMSALGKSTSKNFMMSPQDILFELDYADGQSGAAGRVSKVEQDLTGYRTSPWYGVGA